MPKSYEFRETVRVEAQADRIRAERPLHVDSLAQATRIGAHVEMHDDPQKDLVVQRERLSTTYPYIQL